MSKIPPGYTKPKVGIIYSDNEKTSLESRNFSFWLAGVLADTGYANCILIAYNPDNLFDVPATKRIRYYPIGKSKHQDAPISDCTFGNISSISECHVLIIAVNGPDSEGLAKRLSHHELAANKFKVTVISFIRGVKSGGCIRDEFSGMKNVAFIEGVVGFAVSIHPVTESYISTLGKPSIALERMNKETADIANGAVNLLDNIDWEVFFRKVLTQYAWGVIVYECLHALNTLTGGTISETLLNGSTRVVYTSMIRECRETLVSASRGGLWKPDISLVWSIGNLWLFEMILCLPNPIFQIVAWVVGIQLPDIASPGQNDLVKGRSTMCRIHLEELISSGSRHQSSMIICQCVSDRIKSLENENLQSIGSNRNLPGPLQLQLLSIDIKQKEQLGASLTSSNLELFVWGLRLATVLSLLCLFWFIFIHD